MALASPREASPGPGLWTITDLDSRLSITRSRLDIAGASAGWDRTMLLLQTPYTRHKGRYLECVFTPDFNNRDMTIAWQNAADAHLQYHEAGVRFGGGGYCLITDGNGAYVNVRYPYSAGQQYAVRIYDGGPITNKPGGSGDRYHYIRPTSSEAWTLLWRKPASAAPLTQVYAGLNNIDHSGHVDAVRIRSAQLLTVWGYVSLPVSGQLICQQPDGIAEVEVVSPLTGTATLTFRGDGASNFWSLTMDVDRGELKLSKTVSGVETRVMSMAVPWATNRLYRLRAVMFAGHIRTFAGRVEGPYTDDSFQSDGVAAGVAGSGTFYNLRADASGDLLW
jgi:hypothetical protein